MSVLDALYIVIAVGFAILVGFISYATYEAGRTFQLTRKILEDVKDVTTDVRFVKNQIKDGTLGIIQTFLGRR